MEWFGRICSALFSSAHFTQIQWCIKEIWEDCCRQWAVTTPLQILWAKASKGNRLLDKIYTFTAMDQALAHSPWVGLVSIYNFTSFMETLHCVPPYSGCLSEDMWVQQEHNTRISHGKPLLMEHREKRLAYFKLKWKGQYGQDRGFSGFTVQRWFLKAWSFSNVGGTVVPSISAIVLSLALCTCQHHCSLSQDKCWFCFIWGKPRQQLFDFWNCYSLGVRELVSLQMSKFPWRVYCFLLFCGVYSVQLQRHCSCSYSSMWNLVFRVNRESENNTRKGNISTPELSSFFLPSPLQRAHHLLSFICGLSALALNLIIFW